MPPCELTLKDSRLAIWTFCNNWYTKTPGQDPPPLNEWYWNGILIQLGEGENLNNSPSHGFSNIRVLSAEGEFSISKDEYTDKGMWINVRAHTNRGDIKPMEFKDIEKMELDHFGALRDNFKPYSGLITLWAESGLDVEFIPGEQKVYNDHRFRLGNDAHVTMEIYKNGTLAQTIENVSQIDITPQPGTIPQGPLKGPPA